MSVRTAARAPLKAATNAIGSGKKKQAGRARGMRRPPLKTALSAVNWRPSVDTTSCHRTRARSPGIRKHTRTPRLEKEATHSALPALAWHAAELVSQASGQYSWRDTHTACRQSAARSRRWAPARAGQRRPRQRWAGASPAAPEVRGALNARCHVCIALLGSRKAASAAACPERPGPACCQPAGRLWAARLALRCRHAFRPPPSLADVRARAEPSGQDDLQALHEQLLKEVWVARE